MTKTEILEAINATIISNDKQGITADSLNNILTEIVNAMSEGSGGSGYYIDMTLANPDAVESPELTPAAMEHNAQLYTTLMSVYNTGNMAAVGPVSTIFPDMGIITSNVVMFDTDAIMVVYAVLMEGPNNFAVSGTHPVTGEPTAGLIGEFITLVIALMSDGSIQLSIPGLV